MIVRSLEKLVNVFSFYPYQRSILTRVIVSFLNKNNNQKCLSIMPPKRKAAKVEVEVENVSEPEPVKQKRGRKTVKGAETNGAASENHEDIPKRSTRVKRNLATYVDEPESKEAKIEKPKRAGRKKVVKEDKSSRKALTPSPGPSEQSSEHSENIKPDKKTKKASVKHAKGKPNKKTKKAPIEPADDETEDPLEPTKEEKKGEKAIVEPVEEETEEDPVEAGEEKKPNKKSKKAIVEPVEEETEEDPVEPAEDKKPNKISKKAIVEPTEEETEEDPVELAEEKKPNKRTKKTTVELAEEKPDKKPKKVAKSKKNTEEEKNIQNGKVEKKPKVLLNKTATDWNSIDFTCTKKNAYEVSHNMIISTWNIGGIKSWVNKGCKEYLTHENPDIFCVQETKCNESKLPEELKELHLYKQYWCSSKKEGYAGVGILSVKEPKNVTYGIGNEDQDEDGRCITAEYDEFYLVNVYVPNAGRKLVTLPKRLEWNNSFKEYIMKLDEKKPVIICGDMNVSHEEIDLARPKSNKNNAGFTAEEREGMTEFLKNGFIDVYRHLYPDEKDVYSFWTYMSNARSNNIGWRLDYFIVSERLIKGVCDAKYRTEVLGSDHCPATLFINV